jgi:hypothetical protein
VVGLGALPAIDAVPPTLPLKVLLPIWAPVATSMWQTTLDAIGRICTAV